MLCDLDGPEIDLLRSVCAERRVWGCFFLMERNPNGAPFNSGVIVDARGEAPARRRARFGDDPQVGPGGDAGPRQAPVGVHAHPPVGCGVTGWGSVGKGGGRGPPRGVQDGGVPGQQLLGVLGQLQRPQRGSLGGLPRRSGQQPCPRGSDQRSETNAKMSRRFNLVWKASSTQNT